MEVNLRELYPDIYQKDVHVDIPNEIMEVISAAQRADIAYERQMYRYNAHYSLDIQDGLEHETLCFSLTPEAVVEQRQQREWLLCAVMSLPPAQARRLYARFYLGMSVAEIAEAEGVGRVRISSSIRRGIQRLVVILEGWQGN